MAEKNKKALASGLIAASLIGSTTPALASQNVEENIEEATYSDIETIDTQKVVESLYEKQMNTLVPVLEELKEFYTNIDTDNIIKTAFKPAYEKVFTDLGYMKISYGSTSYYNYVPVSQDYLGEIFKNNELINALRIKPMGTARDPDYGIMTDPNSEMGFRTKTEEDRALIDSYTNILNKTKTINQSVISLIVAINNGEDLEDVLLYSLRSTYEEQRKYLNTILPELEKFYSEVDTQDIIKNGYNNAYEAINMPTDEAVFNDMEEIDAYLSLISRNNNILNSLRIEVAGTARDTDYGVIMDPSSQYGFRLKTEEDKALIEQYSNIIGQRPLVNNDLMTLFSQAKALCQNVKTR